MSNTPWYRASRRRTFLDFHIPDWDPAFLSKFDIAEYIQTLKRARGTATTVFANSHTGLCHWPTKSGVRHKAMLERDFLGDLISQLHAADYSVVVYYTTVYAHQPFVDIPSCRIVDVSHIGTIPGPDEGNPGQQGRVGVCCPNSPEYHKFVKAQLTELCTGYKFEGIWPDMTFWPTVCYCENCRSRFMREAGTEIPTVVNWEDPTWVRFHRCRQQWLLEFWELVTSTIRDINPNISIAHQSQTFTSDWLFGPSAALVDQTDWLSADLYNGRDEMSFLAKLFRGLSAPNPFEIINCWYYPHIVEHSVARTTESLLCTAFVTLANDGAMCYLDAVDPIGTVNPANYDRVGEVFTELERYEGEMGGTPCADVAIYRSFDALFDLADNGRPVEDFKYNWAPGRPHGSDESHEFAAIGAARALLHGNIPYTAITSRDLDRLTDYRVIILPNVVMLSSQEVDAFRNYVAAGGCLWGSKFTSLIDENGIRHENLRLGDVFGVRLENETTETTTYVAPTDAGEPLFGPFTDKFPATLWGTQARVSPENGVEVLATLTLPYTQPGDKHYASVITEPPGIATTHPAVCVNSYGKGRALYTAGVVESWTHETLRDILVALLRYLDPLPPAFSSTAPRPVELTLFDQPERQRYVLNMTNFPAEFPVLPIHGIEISIRLVDREPVSLQVLPEGVELEYQRTEEGIVFRVEKLEQFLMIALWYRQA